MKYIISKDQYRRVLLKFLDSFIKGFLVDPYEEENVYRNVKTSNGDGFANLWHAGPITKGCKRVLTLDKLIAGVYIIYPRYIHPKTLQYCHPSVLIDELEKERKKLNNNIIHKYKSKIYSTLSRTSQKILSLVK